MQLVSFTFLGTDVKIEIVGTSNDAPTKINEHKYLKSLIGKYPSRMSRHESKYKDAFEWCVENNDFQDDTLDRQSNFVFK